MLPDTLQFPRNWARGIQALVAIAVVGIIVLVVALLAGVSGNVIDLSLAVWMIGLAFLVYRIAASRGSSEMVSLRRKWTRYAGIGFSRFFRTAAQLRAFPHLLLFVLAFMFYNDGVQTTINVSSAYATDTLGLDAFQIGITFLVVQFVAFGGALLFGWMSGRIGIRRSIQINLVIWVGVAVLAYFLPEQEFLPFLGAGVVIGLVLGGIQALSRSLYGSMIPESASAEFYGFYSVFAKFSAIWGPLVFSIVANQGGGRGAILSVIIFFVLGLVLFSFVDITKARASKDDWDLGET
jgi:UMF1 family MFS transporter